MATLQKIRNHSGLLLIVVGVAMAAFIIGDLLTSSSSIVQSQRDKVLTVNGEKVTYEAFETARNRKAEFIKSMMGRELDNQASQQLLQQVYSEFVTKMLLSEECEDLGLAVTKAEINELVQGDHTSTVLQQYFGEQAKSIAAFFTNLIVNDGFEEASQQYPFATYQNWMEIENEIILQRMVEKYMGLLSNAVKPNKLEAQDYFDGNNEECSFAYVKKSSYSVGDSLVNISKDDVKKFYEANKRIYKTTDLRNVSYISVALRPSEADFKAVEDELLSVRDEFATAEDITDLVNSNSNAPYLDAFISLNAFDGPVKTFVENNDKGAVMEPVLQDGVNYMMARIMDKTTAPDSLKVALMMVSTQEKCDSIMDVLKKGADFAEVAGSAANENPQLAQVNGDLGWINDVTALQQMGPEFRDVLFAAQTNKTFTHTQTIGNNSVYYIGRVVEKTAPVAKAKVAVYVLDVTPSSTTRRDAYGKLNQFLTANKTYKQMQDSAQAAGYMMMPTNVFTTSYNVGPIADARQAVRFAFENEVGSVSEIFECGDNLLVVVPTGEVEKGYENINDSVVYKRILNRIKPEQKAAYIASANQNTEKSLAAFATAFEAEIDTASFVNFNLQSIVGLGQEPKVIAAALAAEPGQFVGPIAGKNNAVALQLISKNNKNLTYDEAAAKTAIAGGREYAGASQALNVLENNADIEDNRIMFY